jgi:hypothetical protein
MNKLANINIVLISTFFYLMLWLWFCQVPDFFHFQRKK